MSITSTAAPTTGPRGLVQLRPARVAYRQAFAALLRRDVHVLGTKVAPQQVSYLFALVVLPITFLGCIYYPWRSLEAVRWLQIAVLINPLVYVCEGFRAALTTGTPHMRLWAVYGALALFAVVLTWIGIDGFERRTVA